MPNAVGREHAAIVQQRIEDAGEAPGEGDDGELFAAAGGDAQGQVQSSSACDGRRRRIETAALGLAGAALAGHEAKGGFELMGVAEALGIV